MVERDKPTQDFYDAIEHMLKKHREESAMFFRTGDELHKQNAACIRGLVSSLLAEFVPDKANRIEERLRTRYEDQFDDIAWQEGIE